MTRYAEGTEVTVDKSKQEIERLLKSRGADQRIFGEDEVGAQVIFRIAGLKLKFEIIYPSPDDRSITHSKSGYWMKPAQIKARYDAEIRRRWRVLLIQLKVKFETIDSGAANIGKEFLAYIMLPNGATVSEQVAPSIAKAYESGDMKPLLNWQAALPGRSEG